MIYSHSYYYSYYQEKREQMKKVKQKPMEDSLFKLLIFVNIIQFLNTVLNVVHKLGLILSPNAHIAMAILSIIVLMGYSGVLNTIFLKRKFSFGRVFYLVIAIISQVVIFILSFLSFYNIIGYPDAIAIIHGIVGFITIINFTAAVLVVDEQQKEMENEERIKENKKLKEKMEILEKITRRASIVPIKYGRTTVGQSTVRGSINFPVEEASFLNEEN